MTVIKTMLVGRPKIPIDKKKITFPHSIDPQLLKLIRQRAKPGKISVWMNDVLMAEIKKEK